MTERHPSTTHDTPAKHRKGAWLEHVNITVADHEATARQLEDIYGWTIRWTGKSAFGGNTIHIGEDDTYLAIYSPEGGVPGGQFNHQKGQPMNHVGVVVDDLDDTEQRVIAAGFEPFSHGDYEPGRRFYYFDNDHIEWEVVSYR